MRGEETTDAVSEYARSYALPRLFWLSRSLTLAESHAWAASVFVNEFNPSALQCAGKCVHGPGMRF